MLGRLALLRSAASAAPSWARAGLAAAAAPRPLVAPWRSLSAGARAHAVHETPTDAPHSEATASPLFAAAKAQMVSAAAKDPSAPGVSAAATGFYSLAMNVLRDPEVVPPTKRRFPRRDFFSTGNFKGSPRKAMLLARLLPGMTLKEALLQMDLSLKKPGSPIRALVHRVACNLRHNYAIRDPLDNVKITEAWVGKGHYKKQIKIHGRGRFGIMYKKEAHVRIRVAPVNPHPEAPLAAEEIAAMGGSEALAQSRRATLRHFAAWLKEAKTQKLNPNTMPNSRKVAYTLPPWSRRPWKYVERPHWYDPERAYPAAR